MRSAIYFNEKQLQRQRRILRLKIYGGIAAFFALMIGLVYLVVYSPIFQIKNILILRTSDVPILRTSDVNKLEENLKNFFAEQSKIAKILGQNNILIWSNEKIGEISKNYPQIAELRIEKDYFEREIKIIVKERERFGVWCVARTNTDLTRTDTNNTQTNTNKTRTHTEESQHKSVSSQHESVCGWFDKSGIIFAEAPQVEGNLINKVDDFSGRSIKFGEPVLKEKFFSNLLKIFEILEKSDLKIRSLKLEKLELQEIIADPLTSLLPKIYFSLRTDPGFSLTALESLKNLGLEKIEYIDLRVENRAYYKLK